MANSDNMGLTFHLPVKKSSSSVGHSKPTDDTHIFPLSLHVIIPALIAMNDHLCSRCQTASPEFLCFCSEARLCSSCLSSHLLEAPSLAHKPLPITSRDLIQSFKQQLERDKDVVMLEPGSIATKRALIEREIKRLATFQADSMMQLQQVKVHYEVEIAKVVQGLAQELYEETTRLSEELQKALVDLSDKTPLPWSASPVLARLGDADGDLLALNFEIKYLDVAASLRQSLRFHTDFIGKNVAEPLLYKFFGGSSAISIFKSDDIVPEKLVIPGQKFLHNSCWCSLPSGEVIITGGSLTGHSRNTVMCFSPATSHVTDLEPMMLARRCHGSLYYAGGCYVFGGLLDEEKISMCERYDCGTSTWEPIAQLKERRAYIGCCVYSDLLIVCGDGETSSLEIYDPVKRDFTLVSVPLLDLCDVSSLLPLENSILVFHGNFNGEVSRLDPKTGTAQKEGKLCYGNSWSSCAPIRRGDVVYCLRSDSIFKYNIASNSSSYVTRLAKALKRREYE